MLRFTASSPFVIWCVAMAFTSFFPQSSCAQGEAGADDNLSDKGAYESSGLTEEQQFQRGIRRVVKSLEQAETEKEKERLLKLGRKGLEWQYQRKLNARKAELEKLRRQLEQLETDYERRVQAMPRIVGLQLESLKLASEGLINLEDVIRRGGRRGSGGYVGGGYGMEAGGYDGAGYGAGYPGGQPTQPSIHQPIKPDEDPFEGLDATEKKLDSDDAADREETPEPSPAPSPDPFGGPQSSSDEADPFGTPAPEFSDSDSNDPFAF